MAEIYHHQSPVVNPWAKKPWWCQPWSILLTGLVLIGGSWWLTHKFWFVFLVGVPVLAWMIFFLLIWPRLIRASGTPVVHQEEHSLTD